MSAGFLVKRMSPGRRYRPPRRLAYLRHLQTRRVWTQEAVGAHTAPASNRGGTLMARKSRKNTRKSKRSSRPLATAKSSGWRISNSEYLGIVAIIALFLIAAIILKGPAILRSDSQVAGQASMVPQNLAVSGVDHAPPTYVPPADRSPKASSDDAAVAPAIAT